MEMEQFEIALVSAGYNEEQITETMERLHKAIQETAVALEEAMQQVAQQLASAFVEVKETFAELYKVIEEVLDDKSPNTKHMKASKRLEYVNVNRVVNEVVKRYCNKDIRSMNMRYTRYRQKR